MRASYDTLKANAKRRKKFFDLTFDQFKQFCYETPYMAGKGRTVVSFSVDCEIDIKGYTAGNLKLRTIGANASKGKKILMYDWETGHAYVIKKGEKGW